MITTIHITRVVRTGKPPTSAAHLLSLARVAGGPFAMSYVFECYHVAVLVQDLGMRALPGMLLDFCSQSDGADC